MRQPVVYGGTFNKPCQRNRDKSDLVALEIRFTERETELGVIIKGERESERKGARHRRQREANYQVWHSMRGINADRSTMLHVVPHASIATCTNTLCSRELTDRQRRVEIRGWKSDTRSRGVGKLVEWQRQWRFISSLVQGRVTCHTLYWSYGYASWSFATAE